MNENIIEKTEQATEKKAYTSKGIVTKINAVSRVAVKIRDNYYTVEYSEERTMPDVPDINMNAERVLLFDDVNNCVDRQVEDILNTFQNKK